MYHLVNGDREELHVLIADYFARLDGPEPLTGLELVEPDIEFLLALPGSEISGRGLDDLGSYISGRPAVGRKHRVLRSCRDHELEMVYGVVVEGPEEKPTGSFASVGVVSPHDRLARYQAFFHPTFSMFPEEAA